MNPLNNLIKWFTYPLAIPFWNIAAPIIGGIISGYGAKKGAKESASATRDAAQAQLEASMPWGLTSPLGVTAFDREARTGEVTLSPELQALSDRYYGRIDEGIAPELTAYRGGLLTGIAQPVGLPTEMGALRSGYLKSALAEQGATLDPRLTDIRGGMLTSAAARQARGELDPYQLAKHLETKEEALYAPREERDRLAKEARLAAQGRLGLEVGGRGGMADLLEAQSMARATRDVGRLERAQQIADLEQARTGRELTAARDIDLMRDISRRRSIEDLKGATDIESFFDILRGRKREDVSQSLLLGELPRTREAEDVQNYLNIMAQAQGMFSPSLQLGQSMGTSMAGINKELARAGQAQGATTAGLYGGIGSQISDMAKPGGLFGSWKVAPSQPGVPNQGILPTPTGAPTYTPLFR